jgi:hypothetical protein
MTSSLLAVDPVWYPIDERRRKKLFTGVCVCACARACVCV